jgi:hypothetical protein
VRSRSLAAFNFAVGQFLVFGSLEFGNETYFNGRFLAPCNTYNPGGIMIRIRHANGAERFVH